MEVDDWKTHAELSENYGRTRELDAETNSAELDAIAFAIVGPADDFGDVPVATAERFSLEFARLTSRNNWQGYATGSPKCDALLVLNRAQQVPLV